MAVDRPVRLRDRLVAPFWNRSQGRPRAFWRIAVVIPVVLFLPGLVASATIGRFDPPLLVTGVAQQILYAGTAALLLVAWARYVDRRPLADYGFHVDRRWLRGLGFGAALALVGWAGPLATSLLLGWAEVDAVVSAGTGPLPFAVGFALALVHFSLIGFWEEAVFRGLVIRNAVEGLGLLSHRGALLGGWVLSSVFFGVVHVDQAGPPLALGFWILAGLFLGLAYLLTGELAVPIGLHAGFDLAFNSVYGLSNVRPESVQQVPTLVRPAFTGPERFVEVAGIVNTAWLLAMVVAVVAIHWVRTGTLRPQLSVERTPRPE